MKNYLETQQIAYDAAASMEVLRAKAKARMKRIAEEGVDDDTKRRLFANGPEIVLSVNDLNGVLLEAQRAGKNGESFHTIAFTIQDVNAASAFTVRKHGLNVGDCKGKIINGNCRKCGEYVLGEEAYSFKACIADLADDDIQLTVTCAEGAGRSLFKMDASAFVRLSDDEKKNAVEAFMFLPKKSGCWVKVEKDMNPLVVIYQVRDHS